ncbi:amidohydrolase [uncultured Marinobacter sp.]|uniref:amidohydrolase n=1 Tax=uncultured Marinobacter sp. TaxID=187379 RepID=UPI0030D83AFD|tara:strand:+ start:65 stop:1252 length:1188 start_codon:yes stop_codon:yes gene_type:complete
MMTAPAVDFDKLTRFRHELHQWPELGFQEHDTARKVCEQLDQLGVEYVSGLGGTGIVATLRGTRTGGEQTAVGLRADMDALPLNEQSGVEHSSKKQGCMHACGHDGHTSILLGTIEHLLVNNDYAGTVYCIFQPAEEGVGGAKAMMDDGLFDRFPMSEVYGLHNWPALPVGQFGLIPGPIMASGDKIDIVIHGKGGHGGLNPHGCIDPIRIAAELIQKAHTIVGREIDPMCPAVLSICAIEAGQLDGFNVIPDEARMSGTIRAIEPEIADKVRGSLRKACESLAHYYDIEIELAIDNKFLATVNDPQATETARNVITELFGETALAPGYQASMASEDFAFMLAERPGAYVHVGAGDEEHCWGLHNPRFDFNDRVLPIGIRLLSGVAMASLAKLQA